MTKKVDAQDFSSIENLKNELAVLVSEAGQATLQIKLMEADIEELNKKLSDYSVKFKDLLGQEQQLIKRLSEKYGAGQINFETGEFTPEK